MPTAACGGHHCLVSAATSQTVRQINKHRDPSEELLRRRHQYAKICRTVMTLLKKVGAKKNLTLDGNRRKVDGDGGCRNLESSTLERDPDGQGNSFARRVGNSRATAGVAAAALHGTANHRRDPTGALTRPD